MRREFRYWQIVSDLTLVRRRKARCLSAVQSDAIGRLCFKRVRCGGLSPATVQQFKATFSAAIHYLAAEGGFDAPKLPRGEKVSNKRTRYLTDGQANRLIAAYASHAQPIAVMRPDRRGVVSGLLNLSRNLGLIAGASVMGAVFALTSATVDITTARPEVVATGMRVTFAVAAVLIVVALAIAVGSRALAARLSPPRGVP